MKVLQSAAGLVLIAALVHAGSNSDDDKVGIEFNEGIEIDATIHYDPNATTTTTSHHIELVAEVLQSPSPLPSPAPYVNEDYMPLLPAPIDSPAPGEDISLQQCVFSTSCQDQSCDDFETTSCATLEKAYGCDCSECQCKLDKVYNEEVAPAPSPGFCTADCVNEGATCDYWEFNTCEFLESSKGCDCSGCECTGGTCSSDKDGDTDTPECEDWCGNTLTEWESCEYCRCMACDFCVTASDGSTALDQQLEQESLEGSGSVAGVSAVVVAMMSLPTVWLVR